MRASDIAVSHLAPLRAGHTRRHAERSADHRMNSTPASTNGHARAFRLGGQPPGGREARPPARRHGEAGRGTAVETSGTRGERILSVPFATRLRRDFALRRPCPRSTGRCAGEPQIGRLQVPRGGPHRYGRCARNEQDLVRAACCQRHRLSGDEIRHRSRAADRGWHGSGRTVGRNRARRRRIRRTAACWWSIWGGAAASLVSNIDNRLDLRFGT